MYADNSNQTVLPERTYVNARLGYGFGRFEFELWGRNLFDEDAPIAAFRDIWFANLTGLGQRDTIPFRYSVSHPRLRTYGVTWRMRF